MSAVIRAGRMWCGRKNTNLGVGEACPNIQMDPLCSLCFAFLSAEDNNGTSMQPQCLFYRGRDNSDWREGVIF